MKPKSNHRYRICGTPVRTGCITCKIRRVKCDEEKPFCKRCTNTGRKCDGYAPPGQPPTAPRKTTAKVDTSCNNLDGPMEQYIFHFFSTTSAFQLSGNLSTDFWQRRVIQASAVEPSIRHAAIAIGAVHQEYILRHENKGNAHDPSLKAFAYRQYTKAISLLHSLMATQTQQLDFTLISCILFICFDCITGNHDSAIIHLKAGLKILEDIKKQNTRASLSVQNTSAHEWEKEFAPLLLGLGVQAASFVNPKDQANLWMMLKGARASTYPATFHSIDEARHALETTISDIMADRTKSAIDSIGPCPIPKLDKAETLRHNSEMESWTRALNNYLGMYGIEPPHNLTLAANMLKVHWLVISMTFSYPKTSDAEFLELISLCESMVPEYGSDPFAASNMFFSMDLGIVCPLFLAAVRAPKMYIRRQALELLTRAPRREGMWDSDDAILVATEAIRRAQTREDPITFIIAEESSPENELWMWNDISQRLRSGFSWPSAQEQQVDLAADLSTSFTHVFSMRSSPEGSCHEGSGQVFSDTNPAEYGGAQDV